MEAMLCQATDLLVNIMAVLQINNPLMHLMTEGLVYQPIKYQRVLLRIESNLSIH